MMTIKIIRLLQLISYLLVTSQLLFYLFALCESLQVISIENFLEQRKVMHTMMEGRFKLMYWVCLFLSIAVVALSIKKPGSLLFITSVIAFVCLVIDIAIALRGNPLNSLMMASIHDVGNNWEEVRDQWLRLIQYRGIFITAGMISLLTGLVISKTY